MWWLILLAIVATILLLLALSGGWRKGPYGKGSVVAIFLLSGCAIYISIYPSDAYYQAEFERIAHMPFPASGKIMFSETSTSAYSTYRSCASFVVSEKDAYALKQATVLEQNAETPELSSACPPPTRQCHEKSLGYMAQSCSASPAGEFWQWGLLSDGRSVVYHTMRWKNRNPV